MRMTEAELAALERLLKAMRDDPALDALIILHGITSGQEQAFEDLARAKAASGLTPEDARKVRAFLAKHGDEALQALTRLVTKKDASTLLSWLRAECRQDAVSPGVDVIAAKGGIQFAADFLFGWPGGRCDLFFLSPKTTGAERAANIEHKDKFGLTTFIPYLRNDGDGDGKHPVDALSDVQRVRDMFTAMRGGGRAIVPIIFSDSHKTIDHVGYAARCVEAFDDLVDGWIIYLEPNDTAKDATVNAVGNAVRARTKKMVGIQTHSIGGTKADTSKLHWVSQPWCDFVAVQISHPNEPIARKDVAAVWRRLMLAANGKRVIPFEYSWKTDDYLLGDEFAKHGASALGDGCSRETIIKLPRILRTSGNVETPPVTQPGNVTFTIHKPQRDYVAFTGCDRKKWPEKNVKGKLCNGMLTVNGKGKEWIPKSRENTGLRNFLPGGDFAQSIRKGDVLRFQVCDINGKLRNPAYVGEGTYR